MKLCKFIRDEEYSVNGINAIKKKKGDEVKLNDWLIEALLAKKSIEVVQFKRTDTQSTPKFDLENKKIEPQENKKEEAPKRRGRKPKISAE